VLQRHKSPVQITFPEECGLLPGCIAETSPAGLTELAEFGTVDLIELAQIGVIEIALRP